MIKGIGMQLNCRGLLRSLKKSKTFIDRVLTPIEIEMFRLLPFHRQG